MRCVFVAGLMTVIVAPEITAPVESVTEPVISPAGPCAQIPTEDKNRIVIAVPTCLIVHPPERLDTIIVRPASQAMGSASLSDQNTNFKLIWETRAGSEPAITPKFGEPSIFPGALKLV